MICAIGLNIELCLLYGKKIAAEAECSLVWMLMRNTQSVIIKRRNILWVLEYKLMAQKQRNRDRFEKGKGASITINSISSDPNEIDIDNVRLIDYGDKDDEIFKDLSINDEESADVLDITKIYENELEESDAQFDIEDENMKKIQGFEESINQKSSNKRNILSTFYPHIDIGCSSKVPDLNSDVDNDICKENIKKIYSYLHEDLQKEEDVEAEIEKTMKYINFTADK